MTREELLKIIREQPPGQLEIIAGLIMPFMWPHWWIEINEKVIDREFDQKKALCVAVCRIEMYRFRSIPSDSDFDFFNNRLHQTTHGEAVSIWKSNTYKMYSKWPGEL